MSSDGMNQGYNPCVCSMTPFYDNENIPAYIWKV